MNTSVCPLPRGETLSAEFALGCSRRRNNRSVPVNANSDVVGLHHFVRQSTGLHYPKEGCSVDYASVRVDDDPVVG